MYVILSKSKTIFNKKNIFIIEVLNNKYYYSILNKNFDLIENCVHFFCNNKVKIKILNKILEKKRINDLHYSKETIIFNNSIIKEAIKIFDAKVDKISINNK